MTECKDRDKFPKSVNEKSFFLEKAWIMSEIAVILHQNTKLYNICEKNII